jgi:hypothetical protein
MAAVEHRDVGAERLELARHALGHCLRARRRARRLDLDELAQQLVQAAHATA